MENPYELKQAAPEQHYKESLLHLIDGAIKAVRTIAPTGELDGVTQQEKMLAIDSAQEWIDHEKIRADICAAFGVQNDPEHAVQFPIDSETSEDAAVMQRAFRAFIVLIDKKTGERMYGEGRVFHITMFKHLIEELFKARHEEKEAGTDGIFYKSISGSDFIYFKGLLDIENFSSLSEKAGRVLRTPIYDENGELIETPKDWFITGHNLPEADVPRVD